MPGLKWELRNSQKNFYRNGLFAQKIQYLYILYSAFRVELFKKPIYLRRPRQKIDAGPILTCEQSVKSEFLHCWCSSTVASASRPSWGDHFQQAGAPHPSTFQSFCCVLTYFFQHNLSKVSSGKYCNWQFPKYSVLFVTLSFSKCRMTLYPIEQGAQYSAIDLQCSFCLKKRNFTLAQ